MSGQLSISQKQAAIELIEKKRSKTGGQYLYLDQRFVLTVDIEKAFNYVDHQFLINVLKTFGFEKYLVRWIKIPLKNQESCIINRGIIMKYFKLERGTPQGDLISAYLFILVLEVVLQ